MGSTAESGGFISFGSMRESPAPGCWCSGDQQILTLVFVQEGDRFWHIAECYIRGNTVKYIRISEEVIDMVKDEPLKRTRLRPAWTLLRMEHSLTDGPSLCGVCACVRVCVCVRINGLQGNRQTTVRAAAVAVGRWTCVDVVAVGNAVTTTSRAATGAVSGMCDTEEGSKGW